ELAEWNAECEMRSRRREEVPAVKRARDRLERVLGICELVRLGDSAKLLGGRNEQPVVRPDVDTPVSVTQSKRAPRAAHSRIDDGEVNSLGHERERVRQRERSLQDGLRGDAVGDVDDLDLRRDPLHHTVTGADEVILQAKVRQECDDARHSAAESTRPATSCVTASATTVRPAARAAAVVCGPIVIAGRVEPSLAQASAAEGEASRTRSPSGGGGTSSTVR